MEATAVSPPDQAPAAARSISAVCMRAAVGFFAVLALFTTFHALGAAPWLTDEPVYHEAGNLYVEHQDFGFNREHPPLGKYLIGVSQFAFGDSAWATRLPGALATLITGILLALLVARAVGQLPALATFAVWTLLPHPRATFDISRAAYLDTIMVAFSTFALYAAWRWRESISWKWAIAMGAGLGLAIATKLSAINLVPAFAVLLLTHDQLVQRLKQFGAGVAAGCLTFIVTYLPFGFVKGAQAIGYMVSFQLAHGDNGHRVPVEGHVYRHPPWWAQASWLWDASHITAIVTVASLVLAPFLVRRRISAFLLVATLVPVGIFAFVAPILLPHWMYVWTPTMAALIGITLGVSLMRAGAWRIAGLALVVALAFPAFQHVRYVADLHSAVNRPHGALLTAVDRPSSRLLAPRPYSSASQYPSAFPPIRP